MGSAAYLKFNLDNRLSYLVSLAQVRARYRRCHLTAGDVVT